MKDVVVKYDPATNKTVFEFSISNQLDLFQTMSEIGEVTSQNVCKYKKKDGNRCNSTNLSYLVREVDGNHYYEKRCNTCGATFMYGQHKKKDTLFPKWEEGWKKFNPETKQREDGF